MSSSKTQAAVLRSARLHTGASVKDNLRKAREEAKARQAKLEELAAPIHTAIERLARLDGVVGARAVAAERKEKALLEACEKKIAAVKAEYEIKVAELRATTQTDMADARSAQASDEQEALTDYARAILDFRDGVSAGELAVVLGLSARAVKSVIAEAEQTVNEADSDPSNRNS